MKRKTFPLFITLMAIPSLAMANDMNMLWAELAGVVFILAAPALLLLRYLLKNAANKTIYDWILKAVVFPTLTLGFFAFYVSAFYLTGQFAPLAWIYMALFSAYLLLTFTTVKTAIKATEGRPGTWWYICGSGLILALALLQLWTGNILAGI